MRARLALVALALVPSLALAATPPPPAEDARRLAAVLDYVAADYGEAVADGVVVDPEEYEEQLELLDEARRLAARLPPAELLLNERVAALDARIRALAAADGF